MLYFLFPLLFCVCGEKKRKAFLNIKTRNHTTFNGGSLGSCIDEERCELRYVMRIAQLSESSNL